MTICGSIEHCLDGLQRLANRHKIVYVATFQVNMTYMKYPFGEKQENRKVRIVYFDQIEDTGMYKMRKNEKLKNE